MTIEIVASESRGSARRAVDRLHVQVHDASGEESRLGPGLGVQPGRVLLAAVERGTVTVAAEGSVVCLGPGDVLVAATEQVRGGRMADDAVLVSVSVRSDVAVRAGLRVGAKVVLPAGEGRTALVASTLGAFADLDDARCTIGAVRLIDHVLGIVAWSVDDQAPATANDALIRRAMDEIERRLDDASLSPSALADALHVSTRTLHRSFGRTGASASAWIRQRRLERCRQELVDPRHAALTVSAIGSRWGLPDAAHLSRAFKEEYGVSPRAYRARHLEHVCTEACVG